jgi:hypothetical protein
MNHPGQNIITDASSDLPVVTEIPSSGFSAYVIIAIVVLFTIFASVVSYSKHLFLIPDWIRASPAIGRLFGTSTADPGGDIPNGGPAPVTYPYGGANNKIPESSNISNTSTEQAWCLVGEDMTGRWCIAVPNTKACDADRTFVSKNACEGGM